MQENIKQPRSVSRFREVLPQVLAMGASSMVVMNLTIALTLSTIVIAELHRPNAELFMDDSVASWFGSLPYFCQPIGSLSSGFLVQWLGRRKSLMVINIPYCVGCILISTAPSITVLFLANILLGTTIGFSEAPINSYFGEICQPELRSILAGSAAIFYQLGMFTLFVLGSLTSWRSAAGIVAVIPVVTMLMLSRVPESPIWLIAQGRHKEAEDALCWLRGWVDRSAVQLEFKNLVNYYENVTNKIARNVENNTGKEIAQDTQDLSICKHSLEETSLLTRNVTCQEENNKIMNNHVQSSSVQGKIPTEGGTEPERDFVGGQDERDRMTPHEEIPIKLEDGLPQKVFIAGGRGESKRKFVEIFKLLLEPETFRPLFLTVSFFMFYAFGGYPSIRPFLVEVIEDFRTPLEGTWSTVVMATTGLVGSVVLIASVHKHGKRSISLASTGICAVSFLLLGLYAYLFIIPSTPTSNDTYLIPTWVPLVLFAVLSFANAIQGQIPWLLVTEVFPYRTRGLAGGMAAASIYIGCFIAAKTFLSIEHGLQLYGSLWLFGAINCFCLVFLYFLLPETEGKSLEEIERLFATYKHRVK